MTVERRTGSAWPTHPGEILKEEFLAPLGLTGYALAKRLGVPPQKVNDIVLRKRGVSADMALRLSALFGTSPEFWMNLQTSYELAAAQKTSKKAVAKIERLKTVVA